MYVAHTYTQADGGTPYTVLNITQRASYMCVCVYACMLTRSDSLQPHGMQPTRFLCPWDFPSKYWVGCHFLLQGIFLTQGSNPCLLRLLHCRWILYHCITGEKVCIYNNIYQPRSSPMLFKSYIVFSCVAITWFHLSPQLTDTGVVINISLKQCCNEYSMNRHYFIFHYFIHMYEI